MADSQSTRNTQRNTRWLKYDLRIAHCLLGCLGGVYVLYNRAGIPRYIGSSGNIRGRLMDHRLKGWRVTAAKISVMKDGGWYEREQRLIRRLNPPQNRRVVKGGKYVGPR